MFTETGKIQGTTWGFGGKQGFEHNVANITVEELAFHERLGYQSLSTGDPVSCFSHRRRLVDPTVDSSEGWDENGLTFTYSHAEMNYRCTIDISKLVDDISRL